MERCRDDQSAHWGALPCLCQAYVVDESGRVSASIELCALRTDLTTKTSVQGQGDGLLTLGRGYEGMRDTGTLQMIDTESTWMVKTAGTERLGGG